MYKSKMFRARPVHGRLRVPLRLIPSALADVITGPRGLFVVDGCRLMGLPHSTSPCVRLKAACPRSEIDDAEPDREAERFEIALHGGVKRRLRRYGMALALSVHPSPLTRFGKRPVSAWSQLFAARRSPFALARRIGNGECPIKKGLRTDRYCRFSISD